MLYPVRMRETEIAADVGAHLVGVKDNRVEKRRETARQRGLSSPRQPMIRIFRCITRALLL